VVDEQNIETSVTTQELEGLIHYEEALDTAKTDDFDELEVDDELLKSAMPKLQHYLAQSPFLHESL